MAEPLRQTFEATPAPKLVVAVGDCARNCGVFAGAYGVAGAVRRRRAGRRGGARLPAAAGGDRRRVAAADRSVNLVLGALLTALAVGSLSAVAGLLAARGARPAVVGVGVAVSGAWRGGGRRRGDDRVRRRRSVLPDLLPLAGVLITVDPLGGVFLAVTGGVAVAVGVYGIGYCRQHGLDAPRGAGRAAAVRGRDAAGAGRRERRHVPAAVGADGADLAAAGARRAPQPAGGAAGRPLVRGDDPLGMVAILLGLLVFAAHAVGRLLRRAARRPRRGLSPAVAVAGVRADRWSGSAPRPGSCRCTSGCRARTRRRRATCRR